MDNIWLRLQRIDRRILYILLILALSVPQLPFFRLAQKTLVGPQAMGLYEVIEKMPKDKIVILSCDWSPGTRGENGPQTTAILHHLMQKGVRFAVMGQDLLGPRLTQNIAEKMQRSYGRKYGSDWCNWGYKTGGSVMIISLAKDIPGTIEKDIRGTPVDKLPVMQGIQSHKDVGLIIVITASGTLGGWLQFFQGVYKTPLAEACTGVIAPGEFPLLDSGQLVGLLNGMKGAAEYEALVKRPSLGTRGMQSQSMAFILIALFILIGNLGYLSARRRERRA
ncbi:MAG: hypothetical protein IT210_13150 [Armatimonadetes bacterium]|nr:hypothetical protein [Armatimonadota bacterium]